MTVKELVEILQCEEQDATITLRMCGAIDQESHLTEVLSSDNGMEVILEGVK